MNPDTEDLDQLPDAIVARLSARDRKVSMLTPAVDRAIRDAARAQFASRPLRRAARRHLVYPAAAAAVLVLAALLIVRPFDEADNRALRLADDVDGSGQVDILDAFALARARAADPRSVSQRRIDELTDRIVSLDDPGAAL